MTWLLLLTVVVVAGFLAYAIAVWAAGRESLEPEASTSGFADGRIIDERSVAAVTFDTGPRGYRTSQVDEALRRLAWELGRRDEYIAQLEERLRLAREAKKPQPEVVIAENLLDEGEKDNQAAADASASSAASDGPSQAAQRDDNGPLGDSAPGRDN
ncbi:DivIVA domain-containing protein [Natronoglycomyces albus]|uniref:DivIVA domain-containing protein n=1 Tax=Natronoglycomyces albus TaxID=2811108 RepID=A0A895XI19_9ACTN|nr:DivIVA domain-containing protein [Natronoglycomyces albus]QSB04597.1 DivIVA domain-containing protein [Natronoglycomyces albus]